MTIDNRKIEAAAASLRKVYETGEPIAPLAAEFDGATLDDAYAIQNVNTEYWLDKKRVLAGRKIGVTSHAVQSQLGVSQPDYGMLFTDMEFADQEDVPFSRMLQPRIEGEIGFRIGKDLHDPNIGLNDVIDAIDLISGPRATAETESVRILWGKVGLQVDE